LLASKIPESRNLHAHGMLKKAQPGIAAETARNCSSNSQELQLKQRKNNTRERTIREKERTIREKEQYERKKEQYERKNNT
jgi:hypothetical protein